MPKKREKTQINPDLIEALKETSCLPSDSSDNNKGKIQELVDLGWQDNKDYIIALLATEQGEAFERNVATLCELEEIHLNIVNTVLSKVKDRPHFIKQINGYRYKLELENAKKPYGIDVEDNTVIFKVRGSSKKYESFTRISRESKFIDAKSKFVREGDVTGNLGDKKHDHVFGMAHFVRGLGYRFGCYDAKKEDQMSIFEALGNLLDYYETHTQQFPPHLRMFPQANGVTKIDYVYQTKKLSNSIERAKDIFEQLKIAPMHRELNKEAFNQLQEILPVIMAIENQP